MHYKCTDVVNTDVKLVLVRLFAVTFSCMSSNGKDFFFFFFFFFYKISVFVCIIMQFHWDGLFTRAENTFYY